MRKLATVLALSLAATHGIPTPRGSVIAKNEDDEAVNSGRKPLMGSIAPPGRGSVEPEERTFYFNFVDDFVCNDDKQYKEGGGDAINNNWVCCDYSGKEACDYRGGEVTSCYYDKDKKRGVIKFMETREIFPLHKKSCMADDFKYGLKHSSEGPTQFWGTLHSWEKDAPSPDELYFSFRISKIFIRKGTSKLTLENVHFGMGHYDDLTKHCNDWWIGAKTAYRALGDQMCAQGYHLFFCQNGLDATGKNGISDLRLSHHLKQASEPVGSYCYTVNVDYAKWCEDVGTGQGEVIKDMTIPSDQGVCPNACPACKGFFRTDRGEYWTPLTDTRYFDSATCLKGLGSYGDTCHVLEEHSNGANMIGPRCYAKEDKTPC